jgi:hypothetical protein
MSDVAPPAVPQPVPPAPQPQPVYADPFRTAVHSPWGHAVAGGLALVGIVLNVLGGAGFPSNAPVEWIMNAGITIDLVAVLIAWALASQGLWDTLLTGGRGRYMYDTAGAFYLGIPWALGAIFSAYGVRGRTRPHLNAVAFTGIGLWAITLLGVLASALLYAADLTD